MSKVVLKAKNPGVYAVRYGDKTANIDIENKVVLDKNLTSIG